MVGYGGLWADSVRLNTAYTSKRLLIDSPS